MPGLNFELTADQWRFARPELEAGLAKVEAKLADDSFVTKAPDHVVGGMRARQAAAQEALATLRAQRDHLV